MRGRRARRQYHDSDLAGLLDRLVAEQWSVGSSTDVIATVQPKPRAQSHPALDTPKKFELGTPNYELQTLEFGAPDSEMHFEAPAILAW